MQILLLARGQGPPGAGQPRIPLHLGWRRRHESEREPPGATGPAGKPPTGAGAAAKAGPDGYTLFVAIDSTLAMNPSLYAKLPYDPVASFAPVTMAINMPMVLAVHPSVKAQNVKELLALAKERGGQLAYAHGALPAQVAGETFKASTGADILAVPYKGGAPAMTDTIGGTVPVIFDALGPAMAHIKGNKVRALAVTSATRSPLLPEVPTLAEAGVPGIDLVTWIGFLTPAGVDKAIVAKLNHEIVRILQLREVREQLSGMGMTVVAGTPEQFAQTIKDDTVKFSRIIKSAGIRID